MRSRRAFTRLLAMAWLIRLLLPAGAEAATVRHSLSASDSAFSVQTQHACASYILQPSPHWCNPALFPFTHESPIKADLAINTDQDAYDTVNSLINEPITREFVESLFRKKDFQSFSGLGRLEAVSSYLSFAYVPARMMGAYQLSNPNLPEVSAAAVRESQMRLTSGLQIVEFSQWSLYGGAGVFLYDRELYYVNANALELTVKEIEDLIDMDQKKGVNADVGLFLKNSGGSLPSFSLIGENIFLPQQRSAEKSQLLDLEPLLRRRTRIGSGYTLTHGSGSYALELQLPFWDDFREFDRYGSSLAFTYGIGRLRGFTSVSPLMSAFGFVFMSAHYHVGIQYTNDKQDNSLELRRRKNVYLFASFNF